MVSFGVPSMCPREMLMESAFGASPGGPVPDERTGLKGVVRTLCAYPYASLSHPPSRDHGILHDDHHASLSYGRCIEVCVVVLWVLLLYCVMILGIASSVPVGAEAKRPAVSQSR